MSRNIHNFKKSLARSHAAEDLPCWGELYKEAFPTLQAVVNHREDGFHQRAGIDRSVILENSKQILIDEKVRYRNEKTGQIYQDIALEFLSSVESNVPGWVCKPLLCDYIAYAIAPLGICYLLPVIQLQKAWILFGEQWKLFGVDNGNKQFHIINALNSSNGRRYTTRSIAVPVNELFAKIGQCLRPTFKPFEATQ